MKKLLAVITMAASLGSGIVFAAAPVGHPPIKKIVDVWHCPMTGDAVPDHKSAGVVVGNYRVHFCCGGCPENFKKLSKTEQLAKAEAAAKKDHDDTHR